MSCPQCGGMTAAELAVAMEALVCPRTVIEGPHCHCHDLDDATPACSPPAELPTDVELTDGKALPRDLTVEAEPSDEELIRRVRAGEIDCFEGLILRHRHHVGRIVGGRVPPDMVAELAHEVFVKAFTGLGTYRFEEPFSHWLATIAVRTCYDFWRTRQAADLPVSALTAEHQRWMDQVLAVQSDQDFAKQTRHQEARDVLEWALAQLSPENRLVVTLVHLDGYSVREAAALLGWTVINVKVRAHRARQLLRTILTEEMVYQGVRHDTGVTPKRRPGNATLYIGTDGEASGHSEDDISVKESQLRACDVNR
jgi:RNA polymerase sigma-70 factor (ECF subfamily)